MMERFYLGHQAKSKKTLPNAGLDEASTVSLSVAHRRGQFEPVGLQATLNNLLKGRGVFEPGAGTSARRVFCWAST
jgi:hypothetical protein